jgi:hypothetical protein
MATFCAYDLDSHLEIGAGAEVGNWMEQGDQEHEGDATAAVTDEQGMLNDCKVLLSRLDLFMSSGEFGDALSGFFASNSDAFDLTRLEAECEQPIVHYDLYQKYCNLLEGLLERFVEDEGISADLIVAACEEVGQNGLEFSCVDWIMGSTEFEFFLGIVRDFFGMEQFEVSQDLEQFSYFKSEDSGDK